MLKEQKKSKDDPKLHFEGNTDVEEIFEGDTDDSDEGEEEVHEEDFIGNQNKPMWPGPTSRPHHEFDKEEE
jgi:hypothetical protein